ncbi:hypothetical protein B566_EDAN004262 [Ephemera danica]|nr:hypothetical protein B566_EDAN004262 [Ephemera danica]
MCRQPTQLDAMEKKDEACSIPLKALPVKGPAESLNERCCANGKGKKMMHQRIPITRWLPQYKRVDFLPDLIAGITVGLTLIPQSIAYASLAGLEPQYGLYSSFLGSFVYIIFGTVKEVNLGPAALLSLLTFNYTHHLGPEFAVLLCFFAGCLELLFGLLHLGFLVEFVSTPVVSGFTSAAAIMIASAQVKGLLGLKFDAESFTETWSGIFSHISETRMGDVVLALCCCTVLLTLKFLREILRLGNNEDKSGGKKEMLSRGVWFVSTARNAIVVLICASVAAYLTVHNGETPFLLTGRVRSGLPLIQLPAMSTEVGNTTYTFVEMAAALGSGVIVTPVVAVITNLAIGKAFAEGRMLDATQEMMTLGLCNIAGSLVGSMPVSGSFSRSAVSNASGIRSPLAGLYTGVMVLLSLSLLTPYFYYIPRATLASVIICAVVFLVDLSVLKPMWNASKRDLAILLGTFIACLGIGMEKGLVIGVLLSIILLLYTNARPKVRVEITRSDCDVEFILISPSLGLLFPAADHVRAAVQRACSKHPQIPVVINCANVASIDFTAAQYGLYSAFLGSFVYIVFGTVKEVNLGPKALLALLTFNYTYHLGPKFVVLLCFLCGCFELLCGILHLGFLVNFVSSPVISGYTWATVVVIATSQLKGLLGLQFKSESLLQTLSGVATRISETRAGDATLGFCCCFMLLSLKVGRVTAGLPPLQLPPMSAQLSNNKTLGFFEMANELRTGVVAMSVVAIISNLAIGRAFSQGRMFDATQEMITLGLCNIAGSLVGSMPVAGAFSRSAISNASGIRTPLAGLYTERDVASFGTTFVASLIWGIDLGLAAGVFLDVLFLLISHARPSVYTSCIQDDISGHNYLLVTPSLGLRFPATDHVRAAVQKACLKQPKPQHIVLDCIKFVDIDFTAAQSIRSLANELQQNGRELLLLNALPEVLRVIANVCGPLKHAATQLELTLLLTGV